MASGWNLWVWLVSVVVRRYIYYRYPHNNYYFPLLHLFWGSIIPISLFILKCFFVLLYVITIAIATHACVGSDLAHRLLFFTALRPASVPFRVNRQQGGFSSRQTSEQEV